MRISIEGQEITNRFFETMALLKASKDLRCVQRFCDAHEIDKRNFMFVKKNPATSVLKPEWIYYLCRDYGIRTDYLIYGVGDMYVKKEEQ